MQKHYWRRVRERTTADTRRALNIETRERVVIGIVIAITAIALLWVFGSSKDAAWDEAVAKIGPWALLILAVFPIVWILKFVRTPALLEAERGAVADADIAALGTQVAALAEKIDALPRAELILVEDRNEWWLEVRGYSADAEYTAYIDFAETTYAGFGRDSALVQWSSKTSKEAAKFIPAGGRARFFLYGVDDNSGLWRAEFRYLRGDTNYHGYGHYCWSEITEPPSPVHPSDKGILKIIVTAKPCLQGGSMVYRFAFDGHTVRVIEGEVQTLQ